MPNAHTDCQVQQSARNFSCQGRSRKIQWRPVLVHWGCLGPGPSTKSGPLRESAINSRRRLAEPRRMRAVSNSFADFVARLHNRDDAAARELFGRFTHQLIALALRHIDAGLRHKVDPEDVVQSAYKSFFFRYGDGKLDVVNWNSLWGLLSLITVRKCAERAAYHRAERRDAAREVSPPRDEEAAPWLEPARPRADAARSGRAERNGRTTAGRPGRGRAPRPGIEPARVTRPGRSANGSGGPSAPSACCGRASGIGSNGCRSRID